MKTVLFDLLHSQPERGVKFHGGGEYIKSVFRELCLTVHNRIRMIVFYDFDAFMDDWVLELIRERNIQALDIKKAEGIKTVLSQYSIDVFYTGMPYHYDSSMFRQGRTYTIGTFHGLRVAECPHDEYEYKYMNGKIRRKEQIRFYLKNTKCFGYGKAKQAALKDYETCIGSFDRIITDSEHSLYSLANYFPQVDKNTMEIIYPPMKYNGNVLNRKFKGKFFLLISGNRWIKNVYRALKALDDLYDRGHLKNIKAVVVGNVPVNIVAEMKHREKFKFMAYVDDDILSGFYRDCEAFIYPTLNEGFGYPPLEAMRFGTTCIVSAVCSLPEICGDAVYYVNPLDIGELQNRMLHAADKKIKPETVIAQYEKIRHRQERDLKRLCDIICEGRDGIV